MHFQNCFATAQIGEVDHDLAIEAARSGECLIEHVRPVGRSDDHDAGGLIESIHLNQQLIECLILIGRGGVVAASALAAERVDLVDKDDARRKLAGARKQAPHARRADTGKLLLETRSGD